MVLLGWCFCGFINFLFCGLMRCLCFMGFSCGFVSFFGGLLVFFCGFISLFWCSISFLG